MPLKISKRCKVEQCNVQEDKEIYNRLKATLLAIKGPKLFPKDKEIVPQRIFSPSDVRFWFPISQVDQYAIPYPQKGKK